MHRVKQISELDWPEIANPIDLCEISISFKLVEKKLAVSFFEYVEDGLGPAVGVFVDIANRCCFMREILNEGTELDSKRLLVQMLSFEKSPYDLIVSIQDILDIEKEKFSWIRTELGSPAWEIWGFVDGVQKNVKSFHEENFAVYAMEKMSKSDGVEYCLTFNQVDDKRRF